jgi:hypothetical protein
MPTVSSSTMVRDAGDDGRPLPAFRETRPVANGGRA